MRVTTYEYLQDNGKREGCSTIVASKVIFDDGFEKCLLKKLPRKEAIKEAIELRKIGDQIRKEDAEKKERLILKTKKTMQKLLRRLSNVETINIHYTGEGFWTNTADNLFVKQKGRKFIFYSVPGGRYCWPNLYNIDEAEKIIRKYAGDRQKAENRHYAGKNKSDRVLKTRRRELK